MVELYVVGNRIVKGQTNEPNHITKYAALGKKWMRAPKLKRKKWTKAEKKLEKVNEWAGACGCVVLWVNGWVN